VWENGLVAVTHNFGLRRRDREGADREYRHMIQRDTHCYRNVRKAWRRRALVAGLGWDGRKRLEESGRGRVCDEGEMRMWWRRYDVARGDGRKDWNQLVMKK
jgi:hypothetical protein